MAGGATSRRIGLMLAFVAAVAASALVGASSGLDGHPLRGLGANPSAAVAAFACLHVPTQRMLRPLLLAAVVVFLVRWGWGSALHISLAASAGATAAAATASVALAVYGPGRNSQRSLQGAIWLVCSVGLGALIGATVEIFATTDPSLLSWCALGLGHGIGLATTLPFMLAWRNPPRVGLGPPVRVLESIALLALWGAFVVAVTTGRSARHPETLLLLVPAFTWTAARFGSAWATLGNLLFVLFVHDTGMLDAASGPWLLSQRGLILLLVMASNCLAVLVEDREQALRALYMVEQRMRAVLDSVPELVLQVNPSGEVVEVLGNRAETTPPWDTDTLRGIFGEGGEQVEEAVRGSLEDRQNRSLDLEVEHPEGPSIYEVRVSVVEDPVDLSRNGLVTARDVTHERAGQRRAAETEKARALRLLTGGVAHDFNNLLTAIIGNLDLLRTDLHTEDQIGSLDDVARAAQRGRELTHRLLAYSERQPLQPRVLQLDAALHDIVQKVAARTNVRAWVVDPVRSGDEKWTVNVDAKRLESALVSLFENARDAETLTLQVRLRRVAAHDDDFGGARAYAALEVIDNGEGMSLETLGRACDPFFSTRGLGRTGLGLSMVRGFARQSGGMLRISSDPGIGTRVSLMLPLYELPDPLATGSIQHDAGVVVVIAERDPDIRRLVSRHVTRRGYIPIEVASLAEMTGLLERMGEVALVVAEVELGGPTGTLLALERFEPQPALFLCEREEPSLTRPTVRKPFAPGELALALLEALPPRATTPLPEIFVGDHTPPPI